MTDGNEPGHSIIMRNAASQRTGAPTSVIEIERGSRAAESPRSRQVRPL